MILFRHMGDNVPPYFKPGIHWQVEFWDEVECSRPYGVAWVTIFDPPPVDYRGDFVVNPVIDYILVCDDSRRKGVATALAQACRQRWPAIELTGAISPEGEAFIADIEGW